MDKKVIRFITGGAGFGFVTNLIIGNAGLAIIGTAFKINWFIFVAVGIFVGLAFYGLYRAVKKENKPN